MKNIVEFAKDVLEDTYQKIGHSQRDWDTLKQSMETISLWSQDFGRIYTETVFGGVDESDYFSVEDRTQVFAVWYETLASGDPGEGFWAETCLIGLDHAVVGVHNRHVIAMSSRVEQEFLRRAIKAMDAKTALRVYSAFCRILDLAVAVMVDSYHLAVMSGMSDIGMNEKLVKRVRNISIRKQIDQARELLPVIEWNDSLSVGIPSIDDQHRKLVDLLNSLKDSGVSGRGNEVLGKILGELAEYTVYHFGTEEKFFKEHNYPDYENHKRAHDALVAQVSKLGEEFAAGRAKLGGDLFKFLRTWLNGHIRGTDKLYAPYLAERGVK